MTKDKIMKIIYFIVIFLIIYRSYSYLKEIKNKKSSFTNSEVKKLRHIILNMSPREFEIFCSNLYELRGYRAIITSGSNDGGKDIILFKYGKKYYVECKRYKNSIVGRPIAQKLAGALIGDGISPKNGIITTSSKFSKECVNYCNGVGIVCHDLNSIIDILNRIPKNLEKVF